MQGDLAGCRLRLGAAIELEKVLPLRFRWRSRPCRCPLRDSTSICICQVATRDHAFLPASASQSNNTIVRLHSNFLCLHRLAFFLAPFSRLQPSSTSAYHHQPHLRRRTNSTQRISLSLLFNSSFFSYPSSLHPVSSINTFFSFSFYPLNQQWVAYVRQQVFMNFKNTD